MASQAQQSVLLDLPTELLDKIVKEFVPWRSLNQVRLVCSALNEAASPGALQHVTLGYGTPKFKKRARALINMGSSAFDTATTRLSLYPDHAKDIGKRLVIGILTKLKGVNDLLIKFGDRVKLTKKIREAIGRLSLSSLTLERMRRRQLIAPLIGPALTSPHNLRRLFFEWHLECLDSDLSPALKQARALIAACTNLEEVRVSRRCIGCTGHLTFSDILQGTPVSQSTPSRFVPTVKTFIAPRSLQVTSCPLTIRYLCNLTSLTISNGQPGHQGLWPAFHDHGVQLLEINIHVASEPLASYLLGYKGLRKFKAGQQEEVNFDLLNLGVDVLESEAVPDNQAISMRVIGEGLVHHRETLHTIWLLPSIHWSRTDPVGVLSWGIEHEGNVAHLEPFKKLTTLGLTIIVGDNDMSLHLEPFLRMLLYHLHAVHRVSLYIIPDEEARKIRMTPNRYIKWEDVVNTSALSAILGFKPPASAFHPSWYQLVLTVATPGMFGVTDVAQFLVERSECDDTYRFKADSSTMEKLELWRCYDDYINRKI
ncbi:hypothetical protein NMY22_g15847 [Coprinellus aureogranulatus]|nr:hypothetical protein NMY22_g15847 [Coprinellus aureogranulatus]